MASVNDLILSEAIRHMVALQRYDNGVVARIIALLNRSDQRLMAELAARLEGLDAGSFSMQRLESLLTSIWSLNSEAYAQLGRALTEELKQFVPYEVSYQEQMLKTHLPVGVHVAAVSAEQVYAAALSRPFQGVLLQGVWADLDAGKLKRVRQAIAQGFTEGKTTDQIIRELRGTRAKGYIDGLIQKDRRDIEAVVRTALAHTAGVAQDNVMEANADLIKASMWSSTLDLRTSPMCFPDSTLALPVGDLRGVFRRPWDGDLIVITTASGKKLRATPNHPVLTARGWRAMQEIEPGKDVLYRVGVDVGGIPAAKDIEVPAAMGAVFDALSEPSFGDVLVEGASEVDFHGDGMRGDYEVNHPHSQGDLRLALMASFGKEATEKLLVMVAGSFGLAQLGQMDEFSLSAELVDVPPEVNASSIEDRVKAGFADLKIPTNISGLRAISEPSDKGLLISSPLGIAAPEGWHDAGALENPGDSGCRDAKRSGNGDSGASVGVVPDDVVSVEREFFSGHVCNLSTSTELYIADGFVVHNCRIRDRLLYTPDTHKPIGHKVPWLSGPGRLHWRCRSGQVPVLKSYKELGIDLPDIEVNGRTRASMDGQVPKETSYADWLKNQSLARQTDVLGETRARLMRDGKLGMDALYDSKGRFLTISELKQRDSEAFKRAGL